MRNILLALALLLCAPLAPANNSLNPSPYDGCGTLVQSGSCVLFQADNGNTYLLVDGNQTYVAGDYIHVVGDQYPCFSTCFANACIGSVTLMESCVTDSTIPFCDATNSSIFCPCGNNGAGLEGCLNSSGSGALLSAQGSARIGLDDLTFVASQLPPNRPVLLFSGNGLIQSGQPLGDGVRCAGGSLFRFDVRISSNQGVANWGPGLAAQAGWQAGSTAHLQAWYRDPISSSPCGSGFNLSGGRLVALIP